MPHKVQPGLIVPNVELHAVDGDTVALWQFAGNGTDETGTYNLTSTGTIPWMVGGKKGYYNQVCLEGDGSNYYARPSYDAGLDLKGAMTVLVMVRPHESSSGTNTIIEFGNNGTDTNSANNTMYRFSIDSSDRLQYLSEHGSGTNSLFTTNPATVSANAWHHLAFTRDASGNVNMYIDGTGHGPYAATPPTGGGNSSLFIGRGANSTNYLRGSMGSLKILDVELSAAQVQAESDRLLNTWTI